MLPDVISGVAAGQRLHPSGQPSRQRDAEGSAPGKRKLRASRLDSGRASLRRRSLSSPRPRSSRRGRCAVSRACARAFTLEILELQRLHSVSHEAIRIRLDPGPTASSPDWRELAARLVCRCESDLNDAGDRRRWLFVSRLK